MSDDNDSDMACEIHNVEQIPDFMERCPYCQMEDDKRAREVELAQRHAPRSYDDPASIDAYRR